MTARAGVVYLVGRRPRRPRADDGALAGADRRRGLDPLRPLSIPSAALAGARDDAELLYVGKEPGDASVAQDRIHDELVERARRGLSVVRLKGGDPFVFGRGGEEAEALRAAAVEFEVVPGVTAGVAARMRGSPSPIATTPRRSRSSPAMRTRPRMQRRSTGRRWPGSPGRS